MLSGVGTAVVERERASESRVVVTFSVLQLRRDRDSGTPGQSEARRQRPRHGLTIDAAQSERTLPWQRKASETDDDSLDARNSTSTSTSTSDPASGGQGKDEQPTSPGSAQRSQVRSRSGRRRRRRPRPRLAQVRTQPQVLPGRVYDGGDSDDSLLGQQESFVRTLDSRRRLVTTSRTSPSPSGEGPSPRR